MFLVVSDKQIRRILFGVCRRLGTGQLFIKPTCIPIENKVLVCFFFIFSCLENFI